MLYIVTGDERSHGSITPGSSSPTRNGIPGNPLEWMAIGFVHAHTTLKYESECKRIVGPSEADIEWARRQGIPVYTVDYVGTLESDGYYYTHGGENGETKIYI